MSSGSGFWTPHYATDDRLFYFNMKLVKSIWADDPEAQGITIVGEARKGEVDPGATVPSGPVGVATLGPGSRPPAVPAEEGEVDDAEEEPVMEDPAKKMLETVLTSTAATSGASAPKRGTSRFKKAQEKGDDTTDSLENDYLAQVQQLSSLDTNASGTDGKWLVR